MSEIAVFTRGLILLQVEGLYPYIFIAVRAAETAEVPKAIQNADFN
jgi:hypothetical protein